MPTASRTVLIAGITAPARGYRDAVFEGTGAGSALTLTIPEYLPGTTRMIVNGREWSPSWYSEGQDAHGFWTQISTRYPVENNAPYWVRYVPR